jgi:hypothetical protein
MNEVVASLKSHAYVDAPPDAAAQLAHLENVHQCRLPDDFKDLYRSVGGAELFDGRYEILRLSDISSVGPLQGGEYGRLCCSPSWLAFLDVRDGDYVAIDTVSSQVLDCNHEEMGRARIIALSVTAFLNKLLTDGPDPYWLTSDFVPFGELVFEPTAEFHRLADRDFWVGLGSEQGPEQCKIPACGRLHISLSTLCRRHHYENVRGRACPFDSN